MQMRILPRLAMVITCALPLAGCGGDEEPVVPERPRETLPEPGALTAGVAEVKMPVPLGVGTMGYGALASEDSITPFAEQFPGTVRQHAALTLKAVALSRGEAHEVIFVRADTIGIFQQLREAILDELEARTGRDLDDALVLAGNHTHSGPGRLLMAEGTLTLLADTFFPELYDRIVAAFADVVEQALADRRPAEIGHGMASSSEGHNDRRCENDALDQIQESPDLPVVVVRRDGTIDALISSYAYHGTVLGIGDLTLSGDMGSVVEQKIAERFDHPVSVLFFNSWGADMSPGKGESDPGATGAELPGGYDKMEELGVLLADAVMPVVEQVSFDGEPVVRARTYRTRLDREAIGYAELEFYYPHGGVFCGLGGEGNCTDATPLQNLDRACLSFGKDEPAPKQTLFTAGQVGGLALVTAPGEWSTALAAEVVAHAAAESGLETFFVGYAQDFTGYSLSEGDWWQGGYEASGAMWGPRQGDFLAGRAKGAVSTFFGAYLAPTYEEPAPLAPFEGYSYDPYLPESPVGLGTIVEDAPPTLTASEVLRFTVLGSDPWLGTPVAVLERDAGSGFQPVERANGSVVDSDSYDLWVALSVDPPYADEPNAAQRSFAWSFHLPMSRRADTTMPGLTGPHRLRVSLPAEGGETVVESAPFELQ